MPTIFAYMYLRNNYFSLKSQNTGTEVGAACGSCCAALDACILLQSAWVQVSAALLILAS